MTVDLMFPIATAVEFWHLRIRRLNCVEGCVSSGETVLSVKLDTQCRSKLPFAPKSYENNEEKGDSAADDDPSDAP